MEHTHFGMVSMESYYRTEGGPKIDEARTRWNYNSG